MKDNNRRKFLKIVGSTSAVSMVGVSAATTQKGTSQAAPDLIVRNNGSTEAKISVALYESTDDGAKVSAPPIARNDLTLPSQASAEAVVRKDLALEGGKYIVTASVDGEQVDERTWEIPAGGVPEWKSLSVHSQGGGTAKIYSNEI